MVSRLTQENAVNNAKKFGRKKGLELRSSIMDRARMNLKKRLRRSALGGRRNSTYCRGIGISQYRNKVKAIAFKRKRERPIILGKLEKGIAETVPVQQIWAIGIEGCQNAQFSRKKNRDKTEVHKSARPRSLFSR